MDFDEKAIEEGINQALKISKRRIETLAQLRRALLEGDETKIKECAEIICGLVSDYESN